MKPDRAPPATPAELDLDPASRRALELDELLAWVSSFARTAAGRALVAARAPLADREAARQELSAVEELRRLVQLEGRPVPGGLPDPAPALGALRLAGARVDAKPLRDLCQVGAATQELRGALARLAPERFPLLHGTAAAFADLGGLFEEPLAGIDPEGRVLDTASPELQRIRRAMRRLGERVRGSLERLIRKPGAESVIRDEFVTQRNGRFVIPVRVDAPRPVRGIVHASSSSGATQFVEPLETVELNNELVQLAEREVEEQERLLDVWSERWRARLAEAQLALAALARVDDLQARALFAEEIGAVSPELERDGPLCLSAARHPLLERRLRAAGASCEPLEVSLDPAYQVLVVSGPNTGGKTVTLKTLGLLVLMAQSGIPVPAREARLPLFRQLRADIGDHQSIQADLSTYSAHVGAIASFLREAREPAIFLFDELGTGTEPAIGAALARAVLESLLARRITAAATTHLGALKTWAIGVAGVVSAAMDFDEASLRPTYRLTAGVTGASAGLEIAERLGLDAAVLERARAHVDPDAREAELQLRRMRELVAEREAEREALGRERQALADDRARLEHEAAARRERVEREAARRLERALAEVDSLGRREIAAVQDARERARLERRWSKASSRLRAAAARGRPGLEDDAAGSGSRAPLRAEELRPGQRVRVVSLGQTGEVVERRGQRVEVRLGPMLVGVDAGDLRAAGEAPADGRAPRERRRSPDADQATPAGRELHLLGRTVEEALDALDRFLDAAVLAGHDEVRIVHGHGTGRLRKAVRRFLDGHRQVAAHRPGGDYEGGDGATVVRLA